MTEVTGRQSISERPVGALDELGAAAYLNLSRSFLRQSRMNGDRDGHAPGPPYVRAGRMIRYRLVDLDEWLSRHLVPSPSTGSNAVPTCLAPKSRARPE